MLIPWIVNIYVVDPHSPVGLENDTLSARPGAATSNSKNAQETENEIRAEAPNLSMRQSRNWIDEREHKNTRPAGMPYSLR
jgi:hypothetical protein